MARSATSAGDPADPDTVRANWDEFLAHPVDADADLSPEHWANGHVEPLSSARACTSSSSTGSTGPAPTSEEESRCGPLRSF